MATGFGQSLARVKQFFHSSVWSFYSTVRTRLQYSPGRWKCKYCANWRRREGVQMKFLTFFSQTGDWLVYTIRLYTSTDAGVEYALHLETDATTTANSTANCDVADFSRGGGGWEFHLSDLNEEDSAESCVRHERTVCHRRRRGRYLAKKKTKFVNRGRSASIVDAEALLLLILEEAGASHSASLSLSDSSSVSLTFDETNGTVT